MVEIDRNFPVFGLHFRRYAPFARFGRANPLTFGFGHFEGDDRDASTSLKSSSRTYGAVLFNQFGIVHSFAGSSGTEFHPAVGDVIKGMAVVKSTVVKNTIHGPSLFGFRASTSGGNPLVPASPDIDTLVDARVDFGLPNMLRISGQVYGDNFPNLEVFVVCYRSGRTALLVDGQTDGGRNTGPMMHLWGSHSEQTLAPLNANLRLDDNGRLLQSTVAGPTKI
jgi:hypothetical protein